MKKKIHIFIFEGFSDWEISYLTPEIKKSSAYEPIFISKHETPIRSMGGMLIIPDISLNLVDVNEIEMLILPGGEAWDKHDDNEINDLVLELHRRNKHIAAICAATAYLCDMGLLDAVKHTSNDISYLKWVVPKYSTDSNYVNIPAITDGNIITAGGVYPIEFAKEVFQAIKLKSEDDIEKWYQLFKNGVWK